MNHCTRFLLLLVFGLAAASCAEDVGTIDRTQPNLIPRSAFDGEWFVRQTVVDVPETSTFSFVGETGDMDMIRWEFQENRVVGYRSYEQVPGTERGADPEDGLEESEAVRGNPIVSYPVEYVDVIRDYNPRTGEQTNVIVENTTDRPWNERDYVRIDWSSPQSGHWFFISTSNRPWVSSSDYVQHSEGGQDAFRVCHAENEVCTDGRHSDEGDAYYVDFTERLFVEPDLYGCILDLGNTGPGDCSSQEVRVRTSFLKVDPEREAEFEPVFYDDSRQGEFGFFRTERVTYDRRRGSTHEGVQYLANVHDTYRDTLDAEGNYLPESERSLRPITYALSPDYPEELLPVTEELAADFDRSFKQALAVRRDQTVEQLEADLLEQTGGTCFYCVDLNEDGHARIGDLRYNFIYWVHHPQLASPLGYGPSSAHPETGRIVAGMAYVYGASVDTYASYASDIVRLLNGELSEEDVTGGDYIRGEVAGRRAPTDPRITDRHDSLDLEDATHALLGDSPMEKLGLIEAHGLPEARPGWETRRLELIRGTPLETMLINDEVLNSHGHDHRTTHLTEELVEELSPLSWGTLDAVERANQKRRTAELNNLWLADFDDPTIIGLAQQVQEMGLDEDELWQYLREQIYKGVMLHEIGHTVGLRHNFGASSDALNYFDGYWPLREQTINENPRTTGDLLRMNCTVIDGVNAAGCQAQDEGRMRMHQYSSIMDYGAKFNSDFLGLGRYDDAAIAAAYGDLVQVFPEEVVAEMPSGFSSDVRTISSWRNPLFGQLNEFYHHSRFPALFNGSANMARRDWVKREEFDFEAESGPMRVPYVACYDEYRDATSMCHTWDEGADPYEISQHYIRSYREYYVFTNFQRDRLNFRPFDVLNRVLSRYFLPLTNLYQHWLFDYDGSNTIEQVYNVIGAQEGYQTLAQVLATPRYGSYERRGDEYEWVSYAMDRGEVAIPTGVGRRAFSTYDIDAGYNIFNRVREAGQFYEQIAALLALTTSDASALGVGSDVSADFRTYSIPYYLVFDEPIDRLFGSLIRRDYHEFSPRIDPSGDVVYPDFLGLEDSTTMPAGTTIDLRTTWTMRFYTLLYGMADLDTNFDLGFAQRGQIALLGSGEVIDPAPGFEGVVFNDPSSGRRYVAYRDASTPEAGWYAADKVDELNQILADIEASPPGTTRRNLEFQLENEVENLEIMRSMYQIFGSAL